MGERDQQIHMKNFQKLFDAISQQVIPVGEVDVMTKAILRDLMSLG